MSQPEWVRSAMHAGRAFQHRAKAPLSHNALNLTLLALLLALIACVLAAGRWLRGPVWLVWPMYVLLGGLAIGQTFFAILILVNHEAGHGMFLLARDPRRARFWNRLVGWCTSLPFGMHFVKGWEQYHLQHHQRPMEATDAFYNNLAQGRALVARVLKMLFVPAYVFLRRQEVGGPDVLGFDARPGAWVWTGTALVWLVYGVAIVSIVGWHALLATVFGVNVVSAMGEIKLAMEHAGDIGRDPNPYLRSRTSLFPLRWLVMPFNISLHFEHHLNFAVPWYELGRYHAALQDVVPQPVKPWVFNRGAGVWAQMMGRMGRVPAELLARAA